jgi:hypothetical protein
MSDASNAMTKQLGRYADAITAFATAQLLSFTFLMAQGNCFTKNVLKHVSVPILLGVVVNAAYYVLVYSCHRAEHRIVKATKPREDVIEGVVSNIGMTRYIILIVDCAMTVGVLGLIAFGFYCRHEFYIDGKG